MLPKCTKLDSGVLNIKWFHPRYTRLKSPWSIGWLVETWLEIKKIFPEIQANIVKSGPNLKSISLKILPQGLPETTWVETWSPSSSLSFISFGRNLTEILRRSFHNEIKANIVKSRTQFEIYFLNFYHKASLEPRFMSKLGSFPLLWNVSMNLQTLAVDLNILSFDLLKEYGTYLPT